MKKMPKTLQEIRSILSVSEERWVKTFVKEKLTEEEASKTVCRLLIVSYFGFKNSKFAKQDNFREFEAYFVSWLLAELARVRTKSVSRKTTICDLDSVVIVNCKDSDASDATGVAECSYVAWDEAPDRDREQFQRYVSYGWMTVVDFGTVVSRREASYDDKCLHDLIDQWEITAECKLLLQENLALQNYEVFVMRCQNDGSPKEEMDALHERLRKMRNEYRVRYNAMQAKYEKNKGIQQ